MDPHDRRSITGTQRISLRRPEMDDPAMFRRHVEKLEKAFASVPLESEAVKTEQKEIQVGPIGTWQKIKSALNQEHVAHYTAIKELPPAAVYHPDMTKLKEALEQYRLAIDEAEQDLGERHDLVKTHQNNLNHILMQYLRFQRGEKPV